MKKFASFKVFGTAIFVFLITCSTADIICQENSVVFQNSLQKCWEIKSDSITDIASDNEFLTLQNDNGDISRIEISSSREIWKTSIGEKSESIISFQNGDINLISTENTTKENTTNSENNLFLRRLDPQTGIVKELIKIGKLNKNINFVNLRDLIITKKTELNTVIKILTRTENSLNNINEKIFLQFLPYNTKSYLVSDGHIIERIFFDVEKTSQIYKIKTDSQKISLIAMANNLLVWGDETGSFFLKKSDTDIPTKILRTGGSVTSIQYSYNNLLITSNDNFLYLYSLTKRKIIWKRRLSGRTVINPKVQGKIAVVTTNAVSELLFIDLENGRSFNQIAFPEDVFIKDFLINKDSIFVLTNINLTKFSEKCN